MNIKFSITIIFLLISILLSAQTEKKNPTNATAELSKINLTGKFNEELKSRLTYYGLPYSILRGLLGSANVFSSVKYVNVEEPVRKKTIADVKYLIVFDISHGGGHAIISGLLFTKNENELIGSTRHEYISNTKPTIADEIFIQSIVKQCRNMVTMMELNDKYPHSKRADILKRWAQIDKTIIKDNKDIQEKYEELPNEKVEEQEMPTKTDEMTIKELSEEDKQYYQQKADTENKKLIDVVKEAQETEKAEAEKLQPEETRKFKTSKGPSFKRKVFVSKTENGRVKKISLDATMDSLTEEEREEVNVLATYFNIGMLESLQKFIEDQFMIFLNDGNCPKNLIDLPMKERQAFARRCKYWYHDENSMLELLRTKKDYYINLKFKFIEEKKKISNPTSAIEKFADKFNPGMTFVKGDVISDGETVTEGEVNIAHESNCDNFVIVGGSITFTHNVKSSKNGIYDKKTEVKINVTGNNTAFADCLYSFKENIALDGLGVVSTKDEYGIKKEKIQLYFLYTDDNFYSIKFSNLGAVVFGTTTEYGSKGDVEYYKNFNDDVTVGGNFTCTKSDRFLTVTGSSTNPTANSAKLDVAKTNDKILEGLTENLGLKELEDLANAIKKDNDIKSDYSIEWNIKLQRVSQAIGKIKDIELDNKGNVKKDNTLKNAPKPKSKRM